MAAPVITQKLKKYNFSLDKKDIVESSDEVVDFEKVRMIKK